MLTSTTNHKSAYICDGKHIKQMEILYLNKWIYKLHPHTEPTQQALTGKVLGIGLRDFWSIFPLILIKPNQLTPLWKKSYHSKFFMFFQVVKFTFWYGISMNLKVMLLIIKQIESCKKLQKLNFWPYLDDF